jgi:hypothetical protein
VSYPRKAGKISQSRPLPEPRVQYLAIFFGNASNHLALQAFLHGENPTFDSAGRIPSSPCHPQTNGKLERFHQTLNDQAIRMYLMGYADLNEMIALPGVEKTAKRDHPGSFGHRRSRALWCRDADKPTQAAGRCGPKRVQPAQTAANPRSRTVQASIMPNSSGVYGCPAQVFTACAPCAPIDLPSGFKTGIMPTNQSSRKFHGERIETSFRVGRITQAACGDSSQRLGF